MGGAAIWPRRQHRRSGSRGSCAPASAQPLLRLLLSRACASLPAGQVTVILKNIFSPEELLESPALKEELETDIRSECARLGKVDKVGVWVDTMRAGVGVRW